MFKQGEYIIYGTAGVCRIVDIGTVDLSGISKERLYYTLESLGQKDGKIYTPVDNKKVIMRPILTKKEAEILMKEIEDIDTIWVADEKSREMIYRQVMLQCDSREWVKIIKTLYLRKKSRLAEGKKVTAVDEKYLRIAEDNLYGELSVALNIEKDQMEEYITSRVTKTEEPLFS